MGDDTGAEARRAFLMRCGKFAAITPMVMTGLLAVSRQSFATAASGGWSGKGGHRNGKSGNGANRHHGANNGGSRSSKYRRGGSRRRR